MLHNLARLMRYRGLVQSLVARELKARYRGSVLGFFWSFINPLLLLLIYSFVFKYFMPRGANDLEHYELFLFCGLLPWTWFSSSLLESSGVLISGGNLIKKVLFPAEVLPIVTVLANMVHFFFGLPILGLFLLYNHWPLYFAELIWFPVVVLVQLVLTLGFALVLSALTVHFRDLRDILSNLINFWFFATPIIYPYTVMYGDPANPSHAPGWVATLLKINPFTHLAITYQEILYFRAADPLAPVGPPGHWFWLMVLAAMSIVFFFFGFFVFDRLRDTFAEEV
jgi:homopolymeric O-antigen transport system permease protein